MKKLLFIDDEPDLRSIFKMFLSSMNDILFLEAENGKQGIAVAKKEKPDLIITDFKMPIMNGLEVIQELKKSNETSSIPIIMYTGYSAELDSAEILKIGCEELISKPIYTDIWIALIKKYLFP